MQASQELSGYHRNPRAAERWPEESGRGLGHDLQIEALSCQVWLFPVFSGCVNAGRAKLAKLDSSLRRCRAA